jgi:hypothetical protein
VRRVLTVVIGFLVIIAITFFLAPSLFRTSSSYDQYLCTRCGKTKSEYIRKISSITYLRRITYEDSSVSRALKINDCSHNWLLYRFGHSFRGPVSGGHMDGGSKSEALRWLLHDDAFAIELARMDKPGTTWGSLVTALNSNRAFDNAILEWRYDSDSRNFSVWAATNGYWSPFTDKPPATAR